MGDRYRVIKRLTFDDKKIFEVGEVIPLTKTQAAQAMEFRAVEPVNEPSEETSSSKGE